MTQIIGEVVVECSGPSILLMLNYGLRVSRYVIAGMQMEMVVNVVEVLQIHSVLLLENLPKSIEMILIIDLVGAGCHGSYPYQTIRRIG